MVPVNVVVVAGRVAAEPVERSLPSGQKLTEFRVAVDSEGRRELPLPVVIWHGQGEMTSPPELERDDPVLICGRLVRRFYRSGAGARSLTEVVAKSVRKLEPTEPVPA